MNFGWLTPSSSDDELQRVVLHEFGHFTAAKAVGMRVEKFSLFFPPTLLSKKVGETEYAIGAIPLGGYVKISGMNPDEDLPPGTQLSGTLVFDVPLAATAATGIPAATIRRAERRARSAIEARWVSWF